MSFERVNGLPSGTVLCCAYHNFKEYFGTSTGNIIVIDEHKWRNISNGLKFGNVRVNGPVRSLAVFDKGKEIVVIAGSDYHLYIIQIPNLGSVLKETLILEEKVECGFLIAKQDRVLFSEDRTVYLGRINDLKFEKIPFIHSRADIVQLDISNESQTIVATGSTIMVTGVKLPDPIFLVDQSTFLPSITGCCFNVKNKVVYCDESGNVRIVHSKSYELLWEKFFGYHTGFVPGRLLVVESKIYSWSHSALSIINQDTDLIKTLPIRGKLCNICLNSDRIIVVYSGYAYEYCSEKTRRITHDKDDAVELSEAINSAKGLLFSLRKTLGDGVKKVMPKVDQVTLHVQEKVNLVSEKISKEFFDDEIYDCNEENTRDKVEQGTEVLDQPLSVEPLQVNRNISNKVSKKRSKSSKECSVSPSESVSPNFTQLDESIDVEKWLASSPEDDEAIEVALVEAFEKIGNKSLESSSDEVEHIAICYKQSVEIPIPQKPSGNSNEVEEASSSMSNSSWIVLGD